MRKALFVSWCSVFLGCVSCGLREASYTSCSISSEIENVEVSWTLTDLRADFFAATTPKAMHTFLEEHEALKMYFFDAAQYSRPLELAKSLSKLVQDPYIDTLRQDVAKHYGDLERLRAEFRLAWKHMTYYYPDFQPPRIICTISGLYKDMYLSDSVCIIGLDYFIGPTAHYPPSQLPQYLLKRYTPKHVVSTVMFFLSNKYNAVDLSDQTLLAEIVAMGKTYLFTKKMLPCLPDSTVIGYSDTEWQDVAQHREIIWANFVQNQWLYETNPRVKTKFVGERPKVYEIGYKCPGRIGYWLGWQIVKAYASARPELSVQELMNEKSAQKILSISRYHP